MEQGEPQPDFRLVSDHLSDVAVHLGRCANLPAVDGGARVAHTLQAMLERIIALEGTINRRFHDFDQKIDRRFAEVDQKIDRRFAEVDARFNQVDARFNQVDARFNQVDARFDQVDARFDQVDQRMTVANKNSTARMRNTVVTRLDNAVYPLFNVTTGERIMRFPRKLRDLENLTDARVISILEELGEPAEGNAEERKSLLKYAIGVTWQIS